MAQGVGPQPFPPSGGSGFRAGLANNIFGDAAGDINQSPLIVSPANDRQAAVSVLDSYASSNPAWLQSYDDDITSGIVLYYYDGINVRQEGQTRIGGEWVTSTNFVAFPGIPGSGVDFADLPDGAIVSVSGPDRTPTDSGGRVLGDGTSFFSKLGVGSESIDVGEEVVLTDNAGSIGFKRNSDGLARVLPSVKITPAGYEPAKRTEAKEKIPIDLNTLNPEVSTGQVVTFDYDGDFEFIADSLHLESTGEIANFQMTFFKLEGGSYRSVRKLVPESNYIEGFGAYVVDTMPAQPDPRATYLVRDTNTGKFTIPIQEASVVEVDDNDNPIPYRIELKTTDLTGMKLKGVTADLGYGSMFYPFLQATGHDSTRLPLADLRDVNRPYRRVDANVVLDTLNDLYTNRHNLFEYTGDYSVRFSAPANDFREGDTLELNMNGGAGTLILDGFTIAGQASFTGQDNHRYVITYENADVNDWSVLDITGQNYDIDYFDANSTVDVERSYAVDTTGGPVTLTVNVNAVDAFSVFDATESFGKNSCFIIFPAPIGTVELNTKNDYFEFYKNDAGDWLYREIDQDDAGVL